MGPAQGKAKPWWEDHQESIKRIMNPPQSTQEPVEPTRDRVGQTAGELDHLESRPSEEEDTELEGGEASSREDVSDSRGKGGWPRWAKISLLSLIILMLALSLELFVRRPRVEKAPLPVGKEESGKPISVREPSSPGEIQEELTQETLPLEGKAIISRGPVDIEMESNQIAPETHEPLESEEESPSSFPTEHGDEPKGMEEGEGEPGKLTEQAAASPESPAGEGAYTVNVASFREKARADQHVDDLKKKGFQAFSWEIDLPQKGKWHRVSIGGFSSLSEAERFAKDLEEEGFQTFVATAPTDAKPEGPSVSDVTEGSDSTNPARDPVEIHDLRRFFQS